MSNPHEWHIASDREGFFIEDEFGEEVLPYFMDGACLAARWRCKDYRTADDVRKTTAAIAIENQEPPDPPGWEGGFAENH